jgi:hypothetical protein
MARDRGQTGFRELYQNLLGYHGQDCYRDVLSPWLPRVRERASHLAEFRHFFLPATEGDDFNLGLWDLYALSRVNDLLLLSFQEGGDEAWDRLRVTPEQYADFFGALDFTPFTTTEFTPFRHEVVEAAESAGDTDSVEVVGAVWPGLLFGDLLFSRSGVRVRCRVLATVGAGGGLPPAIRPAR